MFAGNRVNRSRVAGLLAVLALTAGACDSGGGDDATAPEESTTTTTPSSSDSEPDDTSGPVDITDAVFTETSPDCADYDNTYGATVSDIQRQIMFDAGVTVTAGETSCELVSNNIPNHDFDDETAMFAHDVEEIPRSFSIPRNPELAAEPTALGQNLYNGVMLNGVPIDLLSAGCYRPDDPMADADGNTPIGCNVDDPWLLEPLGTPGKFGADEHNAHTQPDGSYHYHGDPHAMFDDDPGPDGSPVIGFAADGFPIYGSYFVDPETGEVREAVSGYTLKEGERSGGVDGPGGTYSGLYVDDWEFTDAGDLDECNGMTVDGQYGYYVVDAFPWIISCLSGTPDPSFSKMG